MSPDATDRPYFSVKSSSPRNNVGESSPQVLCARLQFKRSALVCLFIRSSWQAHVPSRIAISCISLCVPAYAYRIMRRRVRIVKSLFLLDFPSSARHKSLGAMQRKNPHAVALGKMGGAKGGKTRASRLTAEERSAS